MYPWKKNRYSFSDVEYDPRSDEPELPQASVFSQRSKQFDPEYDYRITQTTPVDRRLFRKLDRNMMRSIKRDPVQVLKSLSPLNRTSNWVHPLEILHPEAYVTPSKTIPAEYADDYAGYAESLEY